MQGSNSKRVILIGFGAVVAVAMFLVAAWVNSTVVTDHRIEALTEQFNELQQVFTMRDVAHRRTIALQRMVSTDDPFTRIDEYTEFQSLVDEFVEAREKFQSQEKDSRDEEQWQKIRPLILRNAQLQNTVAQLVLDEKPEEAEQLLDEQVKPVQEAVLLELTRLFEWERSKALTQLNRAQQDNQGHLLLVVALGIVVLLVSGIVLLLVVRSTSSSESQLLEHSAKMRSLFSLAVKRDVGVDQRIRETLALGCEVFGSEAGTICRIEHDGELLSYGHTFVREHSSVKFDALVPWKKSIIQNFASKPQPIALHDVAKSRFRQVSCYEFSQFESIIAAPIYVEQAFYGAVLFVRRQVREQEFSKIDLETIRLLSEWLGVNLERESDHHRLEQLRSAAESENYAKNRLLASLSEEILYPLKIVNDYAKALMEHDGLEREVAQASSIIANEVAQLKFVFNDIRTMSRLENNTLEAEEDNIFCEYFVRELQQAIGIKARSNGLRFEVFASTALPEQIRFDEKYLKQSLLNICDVAVRHTADGCISLELKYLEDKHALQIIITDIYLGAAHQELDEVLLSLNGDSQSIASVQNGDQLSLVVAKKLIVQLGGELALIKEGEQDSKVIITIPCGSGQRFFELDDNVAAGDNGAQEVASIEPAPVLQGQVLLVESEIADQQLLVMLINRSGAVTTTAVNGKLGVDYAMAQTYDLILINPSIAVMDGMAVFKWLRRQGCKSPVVFVSTATERQQIRKYLSEGVNDFLHKPVDVKTLYHTLERYLPKADRPEGKLKKN